MRDAFNAQAYGRKVISGVSQCQRAAGLVSSGRGGKPFRLNLACTLSFQTAWFRETVTRIKKRLKRGKSSSIKIMRSASLLVGN